MQADLNRSFRRDNRRIKSRRKKPAWSADRNLNEDRAFARREMAMTTTQWQLTLNDLQRRSRRRGRAEDKRLALLAPTIGPIRDWETVKKERKQALATKRLERQAWRERGIETQQKNNNADGGSGVQDQQGAWVQGGKHHSKQEEARLGAKRKMAKNKDFLRAHYGF